MWVITLFEIFAIRLAIGIALSLAYSALPHAFTNQESERNVTFALKVVAFPLMEVVGRVVAEEVVFRFALQGLLLPLANVSDDHAMVISGVLFALVHAPQSRGQSFSLLLAEQTRAGYARIYAQHGLFGSVTAHLFMNVVVLTFAKTIIYLRGRQQDRSEGEVTVVRNGRTPRGAGELDWPSIKLDCPALLIEQHALANPESFYSDPLSPE